MSPATMTVLEHEIGASGRFILHVHSTDVRLHGVDGGSVRIRGRGDAALRGVDVESGSGQLTVTVRSGQAPELDIDVPVGAAITADGASSNIEASGLRGEQRYRAASGDLRLHDVRGSITVEAMSGDVDILADGPASILARTVSGDLVITALTLAALRATTTSGDVHIAAHFAGPGPFGIETVSGDVTLAPAHGVRVIASTITGDIHSDVPARTEGPRSQPTLVIGGGGTTLSFRSMSGDLHVIRAPMTESADTADTPPTATWASPSPDDDVIERERLEILRALERADIDIGEADRRLDALERRAQNLEADHG